MKRRFMLLSALTLSIASGAVLGANVSREQAQADRTAWQQNPVAGDGYRFMGGDLGYEYEAPHTSIGSGTGTGTAPPTREQVRRDYEQFRNDPVTADGYRYVGGEVGYTFEGRRTTQAMPASVMGSGTTAGPLTREQVLRDYQQPQRNRIAADGYRYVGGEVGYTFEGRRTTQAMPASVMGSGTTAGPLTREQVLRDYQQPQRNRIAADGYRYLGGDLGYEYEGTTR